MSTSGPGWVPANAWLAPGYAEWAPPAPLSAMVACLWAAIVGGEAGRETLVLPDGCSDLLWQQGAGAFIAGPDTGPVAVASPAGTVIVGVRLRPAAGGPVLGLPLSELRDVRAGLADVLPAAARQLPASLDAPLGAGKLVQVAGALVAGAAPDRAAGRAALLLRQPGARIEQVAAAVDVSVRQLRRRFHATAGYGPKTLQRVYRFRRVIAALDAPAGRPDLAALAAQAGYADQSHLTRECVALSGLTPAALARVRAPGRRAPGPG